MLALFDGTLKEEAGWRRNAGPSGEAVYELGGLTRNGWAGFRLMKSATSLRCSGNGSASA